MVVTYCLSALIAGYCLWVIKKKYHEIKKGQFCGHHCQHCSSSCSKAK